MKQSTTIRRRSEVRQALTAAALLLPSFLFLAVFTIFPIGRTLDKSLYKTDLALPEPEFVGLGNYQGLQSDQVFWTVLGNSLIYVVFIVPFSVALALVMAMMVNRTFIGNSLVRGLFFYPVILPLVAVANIWLYLYSTDGVISQVLSAAHLMDQSPLSNSGTVKAAIIVMLVWKDASFYMVFYLAALKNLPQDVFEAAALDGAHGWKMFRYMTFPLLMPTTMFCLIMSTADAFHLIDHLIVMTQGGPNNSSASLLYYIYQVSFQFVDGSKASAVTAVLLVILLIIFGVQMAATERKADYAD
ncbi:carbohydrate ABC transporter permease [Bifidobacterium cebidarum]|uniref:ABC transporter permease n=1 Tax=Bifidobacterium cebidarum TaxID=2650773 RepID=A0A6I1GDL7_9BIFI|nr:sugar ABC transporter permease [Bifidobacterium cebidarum]KAB7788772.1 ABC transporter permease [Bifidobacterium cebidarum]